MRNGPGDGLAMTLDREGQPVILWTDDNGSYFSDSKWSLMVTTLRNLTPRTGHRIMNLVDKAP